MRGLRPIVLSAMCLLGCSPSPPPVEQPGKDTTKPIGPPGPGLLLRVRDGDDLQPLPSRVIFRPVAPTQMPHFHSDGATTMEFEPGVVGSTEGVLLSTGQAFLPLPAGTYDLQILQGPEYEMVKKQVKLIGKSVVTVDVVLEHTVRTDGWMAADMHIHTHVSFDSHVLSTYRVVSEVTSGVKLMVPTEHSLHYDLQPQINALGYQRRAVSVPGSEYGFAGGHLGVYPVRYDPHGPLLGAPDWQEWPWHGVTAETHFPLIHELPGNPLIIINHPRLLPDLGYFHNLRWLPGQVLPGLDQIDGVEVMNGYEQAPAEITEMLRDWFYFLNQGRHIVGLGNSDTHRIDWLRAGYPRTWLRLPTEEPDRVLPDDLRTTLLGMRAIASNGPWIHLQVDGRDIGDTVVPLHGQVTARIVADAPGWIEITRVLLYRNGVLVKEVPITQRTHPALQLEVPVSATEDGWLVAMVVGEAPLPMDVIGAVKGGTVRPFGFTNPVWIDADGDGKVQPPEAPVPRPAPFGLFADPPNPRPAIFFGGPYLHAPLDCEPRTWVEGMY